MYKEQQLVEETDGNGRYWVRELTEQEIKMQDKERMKFIDDVAKEIYKAWHVLDANEINKRNAALSYDGAEILWNERQKRIAAHKEQGNGKIMQQLPK